MLCLSTPVVPAKAGTHALALDSRLRGNERSLLLTPFVPAKAGTHIPEAVVIGPWLARGRRRAIDSESISREHAQTGRAFASRREIAEPLEIGLLLRAARRQLEQAG